MLDLSHLPAVDLGTVHCLNLLRLFRNEYRIPLDGDEMRIQVGDQPRLNGGSGAVSVILFAPFGTVAFAAEMALIDLLSDSLLPGWRDEDPDKLKPEWRIVFCLEAAVNKSVFADLPVFVVDVVKGADLPRGPGTLPLDVTIGDKVFAAQLSLAFGVSTELLPYLPQPKRETISPDAVNIQFFPRVAGPVADFAALMNLSKGDVLILPDCAPGRLPLAMQIENGVDWYGICDEHGNFTSTRQENTQ
jgi:hypothetical protein